MAPEKATIEVIQYKRKAGGTRLPKRKKVSRTPRATPVKRKPKSISKLKKELDSVFSKFIRARDNHTCYTCGKVCDPKQSQAGHFVLRQYLATRWDEVNVHTQCAGCNVFLHGNASSYAARLEKDYGPGTVAMLEGKRKELTKLKADYYEYWISVYQNKLKELPTLE